MGWGGKCQKHERKTSAQSVWDFSLSLYAMEGVAPACLALQERLGVDVNLFFCCWQGRERALSVKSLAPVLDAVRAWRRVLKNSVVIAFRT